MFTLSLGLLGLFTSFGCSVVSNLEAGTTASLVGGLMLISLQVSVEFCSCIRLFEWYIVLYPTPFVDTMTDFDETESTLAITNQTTVIIIMIIIWEICKRPTHNNMGNV